MNVYRYIFFFCFLVQTIHVQAQSTDLGEHAMDKKMEWFSDGKLGIFIHWGIYAVDGISESWAFFNNYVSHTNYMKQLDRFGAEQYNPEDWAKLIKESGAKYSVITTKHHDGVSLWDSNADSAITTLKHTLSRSDVLSPFVQALKKSDLRTGLYYSLPDWSHPYYDIRTRTQKRYDIDTDKGKWQQFVKYYQQQLEELSSLYKPDLLWFDGDWEHTAEEWQADQTLALLKRHNRDIIVNSRLNHHGDYETPEQGIPVVSPESTYWELCYTMNDSWGYQPFDRNYKSPNMIIRTLVDCIAMGGNLLLDIGPRSDGSIPEEQVNILKELGRWTKKHQEAIYGTKKGWDDISLDAKTSFSKDGKTVYVYLEEIVGSLCIAAFATPPKDVRVVGGEGLRFSFERGNLRIDLNNVNFDPMVTVLALDFEGEPLLAEPVVKMVGESLALVNRDLDQRIIIDEILNDISYGKNPLKGVLSEDGEHLDIHEPNPKAEKWIRKHAELLHDAYPGIDQGHFKGRTALSKDKQMLYLFVKGKPTGPVAIKGLKNNIARIRIVGEGSMLSHSVFNKLYWSSVPGIVYIDIPEDRLDDDMTVLAVLLDKPIELYKEEVKAIESNL